MHTQTTLLLPIMLLLALTFITTQPLLVASTTNTSTTNTSTSLPPLPDQVIDTSGHVVRAGATYYILPAATRCPRCRPEDAGFALAPPSTFGRSCPLDVVVVPKYHRTLPVTLTPYNYNYKTAATVRVSTDLNVKFSVGTPKCGGSTVWKVNKGWFVSAGGVVGKPGWNTIENWFKIEEYEDEYKVVYCPTNVCKSCKHVCKNVGVLVDKNGNKRVALTDVPYKVKFQRA